MLRIAVFASGNGSNFQALLNAKKRGKIDAEFALLLTDNPNAFALKRAEKNNIPTAIIQRKDFLASADFVSKMLSILSEHEINFIILAGYMKLVPVEVVKAYQERIINLHPALIPAFCGKGFYGMNVHKAVIESGVKYSGVTVHFVDEIFDHGTIIDQAVIRVKPDDTPESLAKRIHRLEHRLLIANVPLDQARASRKSISPLFAADNIGDDI